MRERKEVFWDCGESRDGKVIYCNGVFRFEVDHDDVDHDSTEVGLEMALEILNKHWDAKEFKKRLKEYKANRPDDKDEE